MNKYPELHFSGVSLFLEEPDKAACWLNEKLALTKYTEPQTLPVAGLCVAGCPGCRIWIQKAEQKPDLQEAAEGYYTGLSHIAFHSTNLPQSVKQCMERGLRLVNGEEISHNPGMDYVNPISPFGFGLEISQSLSLPAASMSQPVSGLNHIGIPVPDIHRAAAWYGSLGFSCRSSSEVHRESDGAHIYCFMMEGNGVTLELYEFAGMEHEPWTQQAFSSIIFTAKDLDTAKELFGEIGIRAEERAGCLELCGPGGERILVVSDADIP